jgi:hypothetical protein
VTGYDVARIMRRLLIITLCLSGLGLLIWLSRRSGLPEVDLTAGAGPRPEPPSQGVDNDLRKPASRSEPVDGGEALVAELVEIPAEVAEIRLVPEPASESVSQPEEEMAPQPPGSYGDPRLDIAGDRGDRLLAELTQIRADVVERVKRRPLFEMAQQRGVPYFELYFMTKQELFETMVEAEGLPPHDVPPSPQSAERIKDIAAEAVRLHQQIEAEETAHLANNKTA